jgi:hypothetical protein
MATGVDHPDVVMAVVLRKPPDPDLWRSAHAGEDVDEMSGGTFEDLIAVALREYGYEDIQLAKYHAGGADLVARRSGRLISIHVRRQEGRVDETAVVQALQGKVAYGCSGAMVIATSVFTHEARGFAKLRGVILWDQDDLANLLHSTGIASRARTTVPHCPTCGAPMTLLWQLRPSWGCSTSRPCPDRIRYRKWVLKVCTYPPGHTPGVAAWGVPEPQPQNPQQAAPVLPQPSAARRGLFGLRNRWRTPALPKAPADLQPHP